MQSSSYHLSVQAPYNTDATCTLIFFKNVTNTPEIRTQLRTGKLEFAALNARLVFDPFHVVIAANKAFVSNVRNELVTQSVFVEIVYNMTASKSVAQSLKKFGINDDDKDILFVTLSDQGSNQVMELVKGDRSDLTDLREIVQRDDILQAHKLSNSCDNLLDNLISRSASKDVLLLR